MRIYVFGTRGFPLVQGGVEKHCEHLYPRIAKEAEVIVYRRKPYIALSANAHYPGIRFVDLPSTRIKGFEATWHSLLSTLHILTQPAGIVHVHNIGPALFAPVLRLFGKKVVLTYHTANYEHDKWNITGQILLRISEKIALKYANAIIFINRYRMQQFSARVGRKSYYIPNGVEQPVLSSAVGYIEKWGLVDSKYLLTVGRITPEKGFDVLIKAFLPIQTDYRLVIAGRAEAETKYDRQLTDLIDKQRIIFTGYVYGEELNQLYTHAALFVMPSVSEGFPLVLLEAMSYRLPLIVSDIPATRLVALSPECYFPVGDVNALKEKLIAFMQEGQGRNPVAYDLSPFDWDRIAEQTMGVIRGERANARTHERGND